MPRSDTLIEACIRLRAEWFGLMAVLVWWYPRAARRYANLSAYEHGRYLQSRARIDDVS